MFKPRLFLIFFSFLFCFGQGFGQDLSGKVYDNEGTIAGAKLTNLSENKETFTDEKGNFQINAVLNDSIKVESLFHTTKLFVVRDIHIKYSEVVIELYKSVNELDEVNLVKIEDKKFSEEETKTLLQIQLNEDIKNNPHIYGPTSKYGLDFVYLGKKLINLFKKKKTNTIDFISYEGYNQLFKDNEIFNDELLYAHLKIPEGYKYIFFGYCEDKQINANLLANNNELQLIEQLDAASSEFLQILEESDEKVVDEN